MEHLYEKAQQSAEYICSHITKRPKVAVVLGSGLGNLTADFTETEELPYRDIPNFPVSTVEGHRVAFRVLAHTICGMDSIGTALLSGGNDLFAICLQPGNFIRDNFPCDFGIDSAVAMRDNIPHSFDLTPRNGRMLFTEFICQLTSSSPICKMQSAAALR